MNGTANTTKTGGYCRTHGVHSGRTCPSHQPSALLADTSQVALIRGLIRRARKVGAKHATYGFLNGLGQPMGPQEHTWDLDADRVGYQDGALYYERGGKTIVSGAGFDNARAVADLLVAIRVLPTWFSSAYEAGREDGGWTGGAR